MTNKKKLEAIIDALTDSLEVVAHNSIETEYVLTLRFKYQEHYKAITGRYHSVREVETKIDNMQRRFEGL